jgi:Type III restriction enzyme, res subunit
MTHDPKWETKGYFDGNCNFSILREMQRFAGPEVVRHNGDLFVGENRNRLIKAVSLFVLTCGAGKTLMMIAVLFAICREVMQRIKYGQRCRHILWFVKERELGRQLLLELEDEIARYGLAESAPSIQICDQTGDLDCGPGHHDITISCPHALWDGKGQKRSDTDIAALLAQFDTIIWDECDFAPEQIERLVRFAPHAWKFGLTASPIEASGKFLRDFFILAGVASYADVYETDKCLKPMLPWKEALAQGFVQPISHDGFSRMVSGIEQAELGKHGERYSLPGSMATIRRAIADCDALERKMRQTWPDDWFSPHILVVCNTIDEACDLAEQTEQEIARKGYSTEDGWRTTVIVSAEKHGRWKPRSKAEERLVHKNRDIVHPFMRAKFIDGRCDRHCARIMFVVDMAIRGLNNWPLLFVADLKRSGSVNEQVQTIGRVSRLPSRLAKMIGTDFFFSCCHPRWYYPDSGQESPNAVAEAWTFICEMDQRIEAAAFFQWSDLLDGRELDQTKTPQGTVAPFTLADRLSIDHALATLKSDGEPINADKIERLIAELPGPASKERTTQVREHVERVLGDRPSDRAYRASFVNLTPKEVIIRPISREEPKKPDAYSLEELRSFVLNKEDLSDDWINKMEHNDDIRLLIGTMKRDDDVRLYHPVAKLRQLHKADGKPGILTAIRNSLMSDLYGLADEIGRISQAVNIATAKLAGMDASCTRNDGPLDRPSYHYQLTVPAIKRQIKELAIAHLICWGVLGDLGDLYSDVMEDANVAAAE